MCLRMESKVYVYEKICGLKSKAVKVANHFVLFGSPGCMNVAFVVNQAFEESDSIAKVPSDNGLEF